MPQARFPPVGGCGGEIGWGLGRVTQAYECKQGAALEPLHALRPPFSLERLSRAADGRVVLSLRRPLFDGTAAVASVEKNVILASADQVAIDAVAAKMMGFDPMQIAYIRMAHEDGLEIGDPREIEVVGDSIEYQDWNFHVGQSAHRLLAWLSWYGPTKVLQDVLFKTWLVKIPTMVSEVEHDWLHWPLKEQRVFERWKRE